MSQLFKHSADRIQFEGENIQLLIMFDGTSDTQVNVLIYAYAIWVRSQVTEGDRNNDFRLFYSMSTNADIHGDTARLGVYLGIFHNFQCTC